MNQRTKFILLLISTFVIQHAFQLSAQNINSNELIKDTVYNNVDVQAEFQGGIIKAFNLIKQQFHYPDSSLKNNIEGRVIVRFIIRSNGKADSYSIIKGINTELNNEAIRVLKTFPDWIPALVGEKKVSSYYIFPVSFFIEKTKQNYVQKDTISIKVPLTSIPIVIDDILLPLNFNVEALNPDFITSGNFEKPYPKVKQVDLIKKYGSLAQFGVMFLNTVRTKIISENTLDSLKKELKLIDVSSDISVFPGGKTEFEKFLANNIRYRVNAQELKLTESNVLHFVIDSLGNLSHLGIENEGIRLFQLEIINKIRSFKNWIPLTIKDKKQNSLISLPYSFSIEKGNLAYIRFFDNSKKLGFNQPVVLLDNEILPDNFDLSLLELNNLTIKKTQQKNVKFSFETKSNKGLITTIQYLDSTQLVDGDIVFQVVEQMPVFPGGDQALFQYISQNIEYPEISKDNEEEDRIILSFVINQTGNVVNVEAAKGKYPLLIDEAIRLVNKMPLWIPGKQRGKPVSVKYLMPINFRLK
ncbi:MAG TPA: energy transducer TonB [Paludibacter sp.]|nr:energy transducer TonB [Paludibacter sp.]